MGVLGGRDSGLEVLHDCEGGDVELRARTSEYIFVFAFDPLTLPNSLSLQLCIASFLLLISYIHACVFVCLTYT